MSKSISLASIAAAVLGICLFASAAHAQATRTWVSGVGDDANPCSRTAPCKTFAGAISKTAPFGEINCLDPGGFGAVTIVKSIIISCEAGTAGVLVSGTNGIVISVGASDVVYLRGLDFEGLTTGLSGINFIGSGVLHVQHCVIRKFNAGAASGISFSPSGTSELYVSDTVLADNGVGNVGGGIVITPNANANVVLSDIHVENNTAGIKVNGTTGTGLVNLSIVDSVSDGNAGSGLAVLSAAGHASSVAMVNRSDLSNNIDGLRGDGPLTTVRIGSSVIGGNGIGVSITGGATVQSYGNNQLNGNTTDGTMPTIGLH
jgi:hypothetical protein